MESLDEKDFEEYFKILYENYLDIVCGVNEVKAKQQIMGTLEEIYQYGLDSDDGEFNEGWKTGYDIGYDEGYADGLKHNDEED